jgi:hypothetical protein
VSEDKRYITSDIGIAAYLQLKGVSILKCHRLSTGRFHFEFDDSNSVCSSLSVEFLNSDFCKFDNNIRNLKKVLFS